MKRIKIFIILLFAFILNFQVFTQPIFARSSGGGEVAGFETDKFLMSVGINLASSYVGNAIGAGISDSFKEGGSFLNGVEGVSNANGFIGAISDVGNLGEWAKNFNNMAALSQVGSSVNMMGQQQGWDISKTAMASSIVQGAVGGVLGTNPASNFTNYAKVATIGALKGATEGAIIANNISSEGAVKPWVNFGAGLAGSFVGGVAAASIFPVVPNKQVTNQVANIDQTPLKPGTAELRIIPNGIPSHQANSFGEALTHGAAKAFKAIPSQAISMGVSTITKNMDRQDAFMTRQAFSGVYPIVGVAYQEVISDPAFEAVGLDNYVGSNGLVGEERHKIDSQWEISPYINKSTNSGNYKSDLNIFH